MKTRTLAIATSLSLLSLAASAAPAPVTPAKPASVASAMVDAFFTVCVQSHGGKAATLAAKSIGGQPYVDKSYLPPGSPVRRYVLGAEGEIRIEIGEFGWCNVRARVPDPAAVATEFDAAAVRIGTPATPMTDRKGVDGYAIHRDVAFVPPDRQYPHRYLVSSFTGKSGIPTVFLMQEMPPPPPPVPFPESHGQTMFPPVDWESLPTEETALRGVRPPKYPPAALRVCAFGTVRLRVTIDAKGKPVHTVVDRSSRNRDLDRAAIESTSSWKLQPGFIDGKAVGGDVIVPVAFQNPCPQPVVPVQ